MISKKRREQVKRCLRVAPPLYRIVRNTYVVSAALQRETFALLRFAPRLIGGRLLAKKAQSWAQALPVQSVPRIDGPAGSTDLPSELRCWCRSNRQAYAEGGDSLYLPPATWQGSSLAPLRSRYPADAGLKICKSTGDAGRPYMGDRMGRSVSRAVSFPHSKQLLTFNFLHLEGIAPRLYDLIEIAGESGRIWVAYAVQHIEAASAPSDGDLRRIVARLRSLERDKLIKLISGAGWHGIDFEEPDCNGNLIRAADSGQSYYVDIHNFVLDRYEDHLLRLGERAVEASHFGGKSLLLGGKFLYQEIPGVDLPAKRSPSERMAIFDRLLAEAGVSIESKVVLDIGCNLGLMGAEYLRRGARWLHGWDMAEVVAASRAVLLSIGCTRFSLDGRKLHDGADLAAELPAHLLPLDRNEVVLSYLAIRGHVGWLPTLRQLPWRYMLYEGHQEDGDIGAYIAGLNELVPVRVAAHSRVSGGLSSSRDVALIERLAA